MNPKIKAGIDALARLGAAKLVRWLAAGYVACTAAAMLLFYVMTPDISRPAQVQAAAVSDSDDIIEPIKPFAGLDAHKVELGKKLFYDPRLSHTNLVACASCHDLQMGGADGRVRSVGINGAVGHVNAPTVLNCGLNFSQFWDGRAETLEQQVDGPLHDSVEMGSTWEEVIAKLDSSPEYVQSYYQIYGTGIQREGIRESIAVFERSLNTPDSRFDHFLRGDVNALTAAEQHGYALFKELGCVSCHQGTGLGGNMYEKLGVMAPYFDDRGNITKPDLGRFNVTGNQFDIHMFKVPSLRNVALTAPYFHDGNARTLQDAIRMMGKYQLGRSLSREETDLLEEFLRALTGELNGKPL